MCDFCKTGFCLFGVCIHKHHGVNKYERAAAYTCSGRGGELSYLQLALVECTILLALICTVMNQAKVSKAGHVPP